MLQRVLKEALKELMEALKEVMAEPAPSLHAVCMHPDFQDWLCASARLYLMPQFPPVPHWPHQQPAAP